MLEEEKTKKILDDILRKYNIARENCKQYFERMYKILEFSLGLMVAVIGIDSGVLVGNRSEVLEENLIFLYILPICLFVLGMLYTYNAYSLAVYGNEAETLNKKYYEGCEFGEKAQITFVNRYIKTDSSCAFAAYGVCLIFYFAMPLFSILIAWNRSYVMDQALYADSFCGRLEHVVDMGKKLLYTAPLLMFLIYVFLMCWLIRALAKEFKKRRQREKMKNLEGTQEENGKEEVMVG